MQRKLFEQWCVPACPTQTTLKTRELFAHNNSVFAHHLARLLDMPPCDLLHSTKMKIKLKDCNLTSEETRRPTRRTGLSLRDLKLAASVQTAQMSMNLRLAKLNQVKVFDLFPENFALARHCNTYEFNLHVTHSLQ